MSAVLMTGSFLQSGLLARASANEIVVAHDDALCVAGSMTVEAWLYIDGTPEGGQHRVISKYGHLNADGALDHAYRGWEWILYGQQGFFQFRVEQPAPAGRVDATINSTRALPIQQWVHVATVFDANKQEMRLYIDGLLDNVRYLASDVSIQCNEKQPLYFGRYGSAPIHQWSGMIDELRIVADALMFNAPPQKPYEVGDHPNTIALYHFDELDGGIIRNVAGDSLSIHVINPRDGILLPGRAGYGNALVVR